MRSNLLFVAWFAAVIGCGTDTSTHVNALTGEACEPNASYTPHPHSEPHDDRCQGTSHGDNCDDMSSGKIDCIGDGNSGQGDDTKRGCQFPQPGCDDQGCCDGDLVHVPPDGGEPPPDGGDGA
jgi:hypothetical protein